MDRTDQRQWLIKILFEMDFNNSDIDDLKNILDNHAIYEKFIVDSIHSIYKNMEEIDDIIKRYANKLPFDKIPKLDKAILRTSINEFVIRKNVPTSVSINEAVEIAKKYSREDSYKFINGVLSSVAKEYK